MRLWSRLIKNQRGQILPTALILLALGGFLVVPALSLITTNLIANRTIERANLELYAADAGVEKVLWNVIYNQPDFTLPDDDEETVLPEFTVNDITVSARISKQAGEPYQITSTATSSDGHSTTVICYIDAYTDYSWFADSVIISANDVHIQSNSVVTGNVTYAGTLDNKGDIYGDEIYDPDLPNYWPTEEELSEFYWDDVSSAPTVPPRHIINLTGYTESSPFSIWNGGPLYAQGDLTIKGKGWARLDGTLYVEGDLTVMPDCTIDLNNQTIFVKGSITFQPPGCTILGSGCIIAVGDVTFRPNTEGEPEEFVFVMSVEGKATIQPNGTLYGSVAGYYQTVDLYPGTELTLTEVPDEGLNFPGWDSGAPNGSGSNQGKILTYTIQ